MPLVPRHAFHEDPTQPMAESILPLGDGKRAVLTQLYDAGILIAMGEVDDQTGEFLPSSGYFKAHRPAGRALCPDCGSPLNSDGTCPRIEAAINIIPEPPITDDDTDKLDLTGDY